MAIITIRGQLGSGATEIGQAIAGKLHIDFIDREIITKVAEKLHWPQQDIAAKETPPGTVLGRIAEALGHSYGFEVAYLPTWQTLLDDASYLKGLESVIKELAKSDAMVIRERGSQFILKDYPGAFHVRVVAPLEVRIKRIMDTMKIDASAAKQEAESFDSSRREFIKRYFHAELDDPSNYDLVINTYWISNDAAADIVINSLPLKSQMSPPG